MDGLSLLTVYRKKATLSNIIKIVSGGKIGEQGCTMITDLTGTGKKAVYLLESWAATYFQQSVTLPLSKTRLWVESMLNTVETRNAYDQQQSSYILAQKRSIPKSDLLTRLWCLTLNCLFPCFTHHTVACPPFPSFFTWMPWRCRNNTASNMSVWYYFGKNTRFYYWYYEWCYYYL